jgi:hypothetical protein
MEDKSWIKLYRKILKSPIWDNEKALKIWIWCLVKATHEDRKQLIGKQIVNLKKGQFVTGRKKASEELKINDRTIYDYLKLLENLKMISINSNNKFSIVTIEKWEDYQVEELQNQQQNDNKSTTNQHKQECKGIYITLFNKYKSEIEGKSYREKILIIGKCKECEEYSKLTPEEQDKLFLDLMSINKRSDNK